MTSFRYFGPMQTISVRLAGVLAADAPEGAVPPAATVEDMTFMPGRRCELPADHRLVATFTAQRFLEPWPEEEATEPDGAPPAAVADIPPAEDAAAYSTHDGSDASGAQSEESLF